MASMATSKPSGHEELVLSRVYKQLSKSMDIEVLNEQNIGNIYHALEQWERTIDWIHENEAKENGISYFFFTLNKTLYKFISIAFSNPRIEIPDFARFMKEIIEILKKIDGIYVSIIQTAKQGFTDSNIKKIKNYWIQLYGETDGQENTIMNELKTQMENFLDSTEKTFDVEGKPPILNSQAMMPYDTSIDVLKMHIPILDAISEAYWDWEKQMQVYKEGKGRDEAAKDVLLSAALDKRVKDKLNNFLFMSSPYKPDFIMVGEHGSDRGKVKLNEYKDLVSLKQGDIVTMPREVLGAEFYDGLTKDMQLVILKILQLSDLSIRRGEYMNRGLLREDINTPGHLKAIKERIGKASPEQIKNTFIMNLKRFFLNITFDAGGREIEYAGVSTRGLGIGQIKMLRRLKYISSSDGTKALFKKMVQNREEMEQVANHIKKMNLNIVFVFEGKKTTGGKRRRKRKTRRRKRKTTRRKKTRRRKRTKRRKKTRKSKRKKTKRRRRR